MTNFPALAINPKTGKLEEVEMIYNGPDKDYTVRFEDGTEKPEYSVTVYYPATRKEEGR